MRRRKCASPLQIRIQRRHDSQGSTGERHGHRTRCTHSGIGHTNTNGCPTRKGVSLPSDPRLLLSLLDSEKLLSLLHELALPPLIRRDAVPLSGRTCSNSSLSVRVAMLEELSSSSASESASRPGVEQRPRPGDLDIAHAENWPANSKSRSSCMAARTDVPPVRGTCRNIMIRHDAEDGKEPMYDVQRW